MVPDIYFGEIFAPSAGGGDKIAPPNFRNNRPKVILQGLEQGKLEYVGSPLNSIRFTPFNR